MSAAQKVEQVLADHHVSVGSNDTRVWVSCSCDPNVELFGTEWGDPPPIGNPFYLGAWDAEHAHVAEQIVAALGEPTVEYGVRWEDGFAEVRNDRADAKRLIRLHPAWAGTLVTRTVLTGEWQEADRGE